jgi:hypothetical protein
MPQLHALFCVEWSCLWLYEMCCLVAVGLGNHQQWHHHGVGYRQRWAAVWHAEQPGGPE